MKKLILVLGFITIAFAVNAQLWTAHYSTIYLDALNSNTDILYIVEDISNDSAHVIKNTTLDSLYFNVSGTPANNQILVATGYGTAEAEEDLTYDGTGFLSVDHSSAAGFYGTADGGSNFGGFYAQNNDLIITATDYIAYTSTRHLFGNTGNATTYISVQNAIGSGRLNSFGVFTPVGSVPIFTVDTIGTVTITDTLRFNDTNTEIYEDGSSNLAFKDAVTGVKTLAELDADQTLGVSGNNITLTDGGTADVSTTTAVTTNSAKTTNATHSGEVTGSGALTIADNIIEAVNLESTNSATDNYLPSYDLASGGFTWVVASGGGDMLGANNLSDLADDPTAVSNLGFTATAGEVNAITDGITLETTVADDDTDIPTSGAVVDYVNGNTFDIDTTVWLLADTVVLCAFSAVDSFNTSFIYGSFYNNGSDSLAVTEMAVSCLGTSVSFTVDIEWHATLNSGSATGLNTTPPTITDESGAITSDTSFDNAVIPPGVQVWFKTPTVTTAPTYISVTLLGHRQNNTY